MIASVVAAGTVDLSTVLAVLEHVGFDEWVVANNPVADTQIFTPRPLVVVGVLEYGHDRTLPSEGFSNLDVMLRLGRSVEQGIPTLLIAPPQGAQFHPPKDIFVARCPTNNEEALSLYLWSFARALGVTRTNEPTTPRKRSPKFDIDDVRSMIQNLPQKPAELSNAVEQLVSFLLENSGAQILHQWQSDSRDGAFDMVLLPNPDATSVILVEVKTGNLSNGALDRSEQKLAASVSDTGASLGILIYHDVDWRIFTKKRSTSHVVRIALVELVERLYSQALLTAISEVAAKEAGKQ